MSSSVPRETMARRSRGRPEGWRAVPSIELVTRIQRARMRVESRGERATQRRVAHELGISERTLRTYLGERQG